MCLLAATRARLANRSPVDDSRPRGRRSRAAQGLQARRPGDRKPL